jgi:hypothetical protein
MTPLNKYQKGHRRQPTMASLSVKTIQPESAGIDFTLSAAMVTGNRNEKRDLKLTGG